MQRMPIIDINQPRLILAIIRHRRCINLHGIRPRPFQSIIRRIRCPESPIDAAVHEDDHSRLVVGVEPEVRAEDGELDAELVRREVEDVGGRVVEFGRGGGPFPCGFGVVGVLVEECGQQGVLFGRRCCSERGGGIP